MPDWAPAAVLVVGLVAVAIIAVASGVSLVAQHHTHVDAAGLHDVARIYNEGWTSPDYNPFVDHRLRAITPLLTIVFLCSTTALGGFLIDAMRGSAQWPASVRFLAGFLAGYLMLLAPLQLLFAAVPLVPAAWLALAVTTAAAVAFRGPRAVAAVQRSVGDATGRRRLLQSTAVVVGLLVLAGLHRLQMGPNFMVTDSISVFLSAAQEQLAGAFGDHLLQWDQQSDEWIFNAPLMFTSETGRDFLLPLYATQFVGLASFGCLVFGIVHSLAPRRRRAAAGLATAVVLTSTPAIFPWFYVPLIGGHNPTVWLGHPGRFVAIAAPWVALLLLRRQSRSAIIAIGLATAGLGFVTLHATVYVLAALGAALCWTAMRRRPTRATPRQGSRPLISLLAFAALAAPVLVFCLLHAMGDPTPLVWVLVAGMIFAVFAAFLVGRGVAAGPADVAPKRLIGWSLAWLAVLVLGIVLSNNLLNGLTGGHLRTLLGEALPGYSTVLESRELFGDSLGAGLSFPKFSGQDCLTIGACSSASTFLADWGVIFLVAAAGWLTLGQMGSHAGTPGRRAAWLLMVAALCASFLVVDFTGASFVTTWILTRFLEVPFYGLLSLAALAFVAARSPVTRWVGIGVLTIWTVTPIVVNLVPLQLVRNAKWLAQVIVG
jgi:hypothetical protein